MRAISQTPKSEVEDAGEPEMTEESGEHPGAESQDLLDRSIGDLLLNRKKLTPEQVEKILEHQRKHGTKFGESAVALRMLTGDDVLWALSRQFHYAYSPESRRNANPELVMASRPFSDEAEVFRSLRSQLMLTALSGEPGRRVLAVLSPDVGDGKSFFAANLAVAFSQLGGRTLLVDADMRTPRLHKLLKVEGSSGLSSVLSGRTEANVIRPVKDLPSLFLMPVGAVPPNPLELIQRPAFSMLLAELSMKFDQVIVDTPASIHGADSRVIASKCGAALLIGRKGKSRMQKMQKLVNWIESGSASLAGIVLNEH